MASIRPFEVSEVCGAKGLEVLIKDVDKLVSLPDIYYRLEGIILDPASTTSTVATLLEADPDLSARLLGMANSAFYSFPTSIETVERAVSTVGLRLIREMILVTSVVKAFNNIPQNLVDMQSFWEHSITVGIMARGIARHARIANSDSFYIPGLLHDLGHLVMYLKLPGLMNELLQNQSAGHGIYQLENDILGYSHATIGGQLLTNWKVPPSICEPVMEHHTPASGGEFRLVSSAIHLADHWVFTNCEGSLSEQGPAEICQQAPEMLGIKVADLDQIGEVAISHTADVLRQFMSH